MWRFMMGVMLLLLPLAGQAQEKPKITATTNRVWIPGKQVFAHFYDHAKMKAKRLLEKPVLATGLPPVQLPIDWAKTLSFPMDGNDQYGDCFYASACHHDNTFTGNVGTESVFTLSAIVSRYRTLSGGDNGLSDSDIQGEWKGRYLADVPAAKAVDFLYVDVTDPATVQSAIWHFGGLQFTFAVPDNWINNSDTGAIWDAPATPDQNNGHAVHWNAVDAQGKVKLQTWGSYVWITPAGIKSCDPSGFAVFSVRWFDAKGYAPNRKHITELAAVWLAAGGKAIPAAIINAFPPIGPTPPPPPPPPPIGGATITLSTALPAGSYEVVPAGTQAKWALIAAKLLEVDALLGQKPKPHTHLPPSQLPPTEPCQNDATQQPVVYRATSACDQSPTIGACANGTNGQNSRNRPRALLGRFRGRSNCN